MKLFRSGNYIDVQEEGQSIVRYNLEVNTDMAELQEKTKEGLKLAMIYPNKIVDDELMSVVYY